MKIGVIIVGKVADELLGRYPEFPPFFNDMMAPAAPEASLVDYNVLKGDEPTDPLACDGWLITGSAAGVYDADPWIPRMREFLAAVRAAGRPAIGVCFGHQLMAEALGGRAALSDRGWGIGVQDYRIHHAPGWMDGAGPTLSLHAMHRDQVTAIPADATVLAGNDFCPYAMLAYGDPARPDAISIQPHPEFERPFAEELVSLRTGDGKIPRDVGDPALASYGRGVDNALVARWFAAYFRQAIAARKAA